jgi:acetyltransferase-like isoleucine patch superfamily enzyme
MLKSQTLAYFQDWAKAHPGWPGAWRLLRWAVRHQLNGVQRIGVGLQISGPLVIKNAGYIEIGDHAQLDSCWYQPIVLEVVNPDARLIIEHDAYINHGVNIGVACEVVIGAHAKIANECIIYDTDWHSIDGLSQQIPTAPTRIGRGVWLGARVIVLKGVTIGDNTVVAANATVTRDLPRNVLAAGTPARVIRTIERHRYAPGT